MPTAVFIAFR